MPTLSRCGVTIAAHRTRCTLTLRIRLSLPEGRPNTATPACRTSGDTCSVFSVAKPAGDSGPDFVPGKTCVRCRKGSLDLAFQ